MDADADTVLAFVFGILAGGALGYIIGRLGYLYSATNSQRDPY